MVIKNPEEQKANPVEVEAKETEKVDRERLECPLSDEMIKALVNQFGLELHNMHLYGSFANFFGVRGFEKLEKYFKARENEELKHSQFIYYWLTYNDAEFKYPSVPDIEEKWETLEDPFILTTEAEVKTTKEIYNIADLALDTGDYATWNWLNDHNEKTGMLIAEQVNFCLTI